MSAVDDLPFSYPDVSPANPAAQPKRCRHPRDKRQLFEGGIACGSCGKEIDPERQRQGRRSRRLGGDQERRIERVYGPVKIGERGDPVDHLGRDFRWQSKATRLAPPKWMETLAGAFWRGSLVPPWVKAAMTRMAGLYDPRASLVIRSFVRSGVRPIDVIFVPSKAWRDLYGSWPDDGYIAMSGDYFLDLHGRDSDSEIQPPDPYTEDLAS